MASGDIFLQNQIGNNINLPIIPSDALIGKGTLSRYGSFVFSDLILSLKPNIGEVDMTKSVSLTNDANNLITTGNQFGTQVNRSILNATEDNFLDGDPYSIRLTEVLVSVRRHKVMSTTVVAGRNDAVVEYLSNGSFELGFEFNIASAWPEVMPERQIVKLAKLLSSNEPLTISGRFTNFHKINRIVVTDETWAQQPGIVNCQSGYFSAITVSANDSIDAVIPTITL